MSRWVTLIAKIKKSIYSIKYKTICQNYNNILSKQWCMSSKSFLNGQSISTSIKIANRVRIESACAE